MSGMDRRHAEFADPFDQPFLGVVGVGRTKFRLNGPLPSSAI